MTLIDPREALADQSSFIGYLLGLAGVARMVHTLADDGPRTKAPRDPDEFVHALLGLASLGAAVDRLLTSGMPQQTSNAEPPATPTMRWLR